MNVLYYAVMLIIFYYALLLSCDCHRLSLVNLIGMLLLHTRPFGETRQLLVGTLLLFI